MRKNTIYLINFLIIFLITSTTNAIENKIIVKVEEEIITTYELKNKILTTLFLAGQNVTQKNIDDLKKKTLETLILNKLKISELKKWNIESDKLRVNNYLNSISSNNIQNLMDSFKNNNLDFNLYKKEIETQMMWQELIYNLYNSKINIDENTINKELQIFLNKNSQVKEFKISEIEITSNINKKNEEIIKDVQDEISKIGFGNTAAKLSTSLTANQNGELGWINSNSLSEKIRNIILSMKIGEVSKPIIKQDVILFLKLQDIRNINTDKLNIEEMKKKLIDRKKNELYNLYSKSHLSKLRNISFIEYK